MRGRSRVRSSLVVFAWVIASAVGCAEDGQEGDAGCDQPDPGAALRILPLGDSITQGDAEHYSYRYELWKLLVDSGRDFDLVGSTEENHDGTPSFPDYEGVAFDRDHEGHWGWRANQIRDALDGWLSGYCPDVVLLHIGTNDLCADKEDPATTASEVAEIVDVLRDANPKVTVFVAKIIPADSDDDNIAIAQYNEILEEFPLHLSDGDSTIAIVDQHGDYSVQNDSYDGLHPNESGEVKIARKWFDAMELLLGATRTACAPDPFPVERGGV